MLNVGTPSLTPTRIENDDLVGLIDISIIVVPASDTICHTPP